MPRTRADTSTACGSRSCRRAKASMRWVRAAPRSAPSTAFSRSAFDLSSSRRRLRSNSSDHRQQVVELLRDTAGERADGLDLLRLTECGLGAPARGHVQKAADNPDELPAG